MFFAKGGLTVKRSVTAKPRKAFQDDVEVWIRHWSGEFQNRIAAHFDVNPASVNEVLKGKRHPGSERAADRMA